MAQAQLCVTYSALTLGTICFAIYAIDAWRSVQSRKAAEASSAVVAANKNLLPTSKGASLADLGSLVEAMAKLSDSLAKAGPSLTSLVGAVLFYSVAAIASGALTSAAISAPTEKPVSAAAGDPSGTIPPPIVKPKLPAPK